MSDDSLKFSSALDDNPVNQALLRMQERFKGLQGVVGNVTAGIASSFSGLQGKIGAVLAVLAGGAAFKESVKATQEFTGEANKLARVLGISATEASTLNVALGDIFADADTYATAAAKLAKEIRTNEQDLKDMGLRTREANGELRPLKDLMMESIQVVNGYKQGIDRNIAAQKVWGKGAEEVTQLLKLNNQVLEEAKKKQEDLGLIVGQENVEASKKYKAAMNDAGDVVLAFKKALGDALLPVLTQLGEWFAAIGPTAVFTFRVAVNLLATALQGLMLGLKIVFDLVRALADPLFVLGGAIRKLLSGDMAGATKDMQNIFSSWGTQLGGVWDKIKADSARTWKEIGDLWGQPTPIAQPKLSGRSASGLVKSGRDDSMMAQWEAELAALKEARAAENAANNTFYEFSKQEEKAFWEAKRAIVAAGTKDAFGVQRKVTQATLEIQREAFEQRLAQLNREQDAAEQNYTAKVGLARRELALIVERYGVESKQAEDAQRKIADIERQARDQRRQLQEMALADLANASAQRVELMREEAQLQLDLGLITRQQLLQEEQRYVQALFEIKRQQLVAGLALIDPDKDPVEYQRRNDELLQLERQFQLQMGQVRNAQILESNRNYRDFFSNLQSGLQGLFNKFLQGSLTITGLIKGLFMTVLDALAATLSKMAAEWLVQQITQRVMGKVTALSQISSNAAIAGSAAFASTAAIPIIGPELAPAAAAAAYAGAFSYAATLPSAAKGWDIPAGVNPVTQLHEQEMVLPADIAGPLRDMARGGGGASGGGEGRIRGMPPSEWLMVNRGDLVKALKASGRDFAITRGLI